MTMGERLKRTGTEARKRWSQKMPRFFRQLTVLCACVAGTAFGINTMLAMTGAVAHEWWNDVYPLLIGVPTGMAIVCKLTVAGGYKDIDPDKLTHGNIILGEGFGHKGVHRTSQEEMEEEKDDQHRYQHTQNDIR